MPFRSPWVLFLVFFFVNTILTYSSLGLSLKVGLFLFGILLPMVWAMRQEASKTLAPQLKKRPALFPTLPPMVLGGLVLLALGVRFYGLDHSSVWLTGDEGQLGMSAIDLSEKWDWRFFYTSGQAPPLPVWTSAIALKLGCPPFLSLRLPSAIVSSLTVVLGTLACLRFFSRDLSFLCGALLAFNHWSLQIGRTCHEGSWLPLWACGCLYFLGRTLQASNESEREREAIFLGFVIGLGSWTFTPWPSLALLLILTVFKVHLGRGTGPRLVLRFLGAFLLALTPFLWAAWRENYGGYIAGMSFLSDWFSWKQRWMADLSYITWLFWGILPGGFGFEPGPGAALNPLMGAAAFLGAIQMVRDRSRKEVVWVALALGATLLPGILSMNLEMFRVTLVLPFLLIVVGWGSFRLLEGIPSGKRLPIFLGFLALSAILDVSRTRIFRTDPSFQRALRIPVIAVGPQARAYGILRDVATKWGPGWVLSEFQSGSCDPSLFVATYGFNAAAHPGLDPSAAQWVAVMVNASYQRFLAPAFPGGRWYLLEPNAPLDKRLMLGIIPRDLSDRSTLDLWARAHAYFRRLSMETIDIAESGTYARAEGSFQAPPAEIFQSRFLASCYWEKKAEFHYGYRFKLHYEDQVEALRQAIAQGHPTAHLRYKLGSLLLRKKRLSEAREAFEAGLAVEPTDVDLRNGLAVLREMERAPANKAPAR